MTKGEIISSIANETEESKASVERMVNSLLGVVKDALLRGDEVVIKNFGTFKRSHRKARKGRHPVTGAEIKIDAKESVRFQLGKEFKEQLQMS